jgi:site-specific DNA recombinase
VPSGGGVESATDPNARKMIEKAFDKTDEPLMADLARLEAEREELTGGKPESPTKR